MLQELRRKNELLDIFCSLAEVPSPSLHEENVIKWITTFCQNNGINCELDDYNNVYITIPATNQNKMSLLVSAHMDVVGDAKPVNLILDGEFIKADKRTLGADDKVGVASALMLAKELKTLNIDHGGLEIVFTRDEELNMSGIKHFDFSKLNSKYVLVCDADKLAQVQVSGASYTTAKIHLKSLIGGHSGIDIGDKNRLNAAKLIAELLNDFPQGVYYQDDTGVITSCNLGAIVAGGIQNAVKSIVNDNVDSSDYIETIVNISATNIINTDARASYSIRSASIEKEEELKSLMKTCVDKFNKKYDELAIATVTFETKLPPFEKSEDDLIPNLHTKVSNRLNIQNEVSSFHAGAETHIYCQHKNKNGEKFSPFLLGLADIYNMHSDKEKVSYTSLLKGYAILKELFIEFNK